MKSLLVILAVFGLATVTFGQSAIAFNGSVTLNYANSASVTETVAVSGIETVTRNANGDITGGTFSGLVKVGGVDFPLDVHNARMMAVNGVRWYTYSVVKDDQTYDMTVLLGHATAPKFMRLRMLDARTADTGFGVANIL